MTELRIRQFGKSYAVYRGAERLSGACGNKDLALALRDRLERKTRGTDRPCMCCGETFPSEGIHNRLCAACRRRDTGGLI